MKTRSAFQFQFLLALAVLSLGASARGEEAGLAAPGTANYPQGGLRQVGSSRIEAEVGVFHSGVLDPVSGTAMFATVAQPTQIVRVALPVGGTRAELISIAPLPTDAPYKTDALTELAASDAAHGLAVFVSGHNGPARLNLMQLDGSSLLQLGLSSSINPQSVLMDSSTGYLYVAGDSADQLRNCPQSRTTIYKFSYRKADGTPELRFVGSLPFDKESENLPVAAVLDPRGGYAYWGVSSCAGGTSKVVKVALGTGDALPVRLGMVVLDSDETEVSCAVVDPASNYAYFGTSTGAVVQVDLGEGDAAPTRIATLHLPEEDSGLWRAAIDPVDHCAYFATAPYGGRIAKISLGDGTLPPVHVGSVAFIAGDEEAAGTLLVDSVNRELIIGSTATPGHIYRYFLGQADQIPGLISRAHFGPSDAFLTGGVLSPDGSTLTLGSLSRPARLYTFTLDNDGSVADKAPSVLAVNGHIQPRSFVYDPTGERAYVGSVSENDYWTDYQSGKITTFRLDGLGTISTHDAAGVSRSVHVSAVDPLRGYVYFTGSYDPVYDFRSLSKYRAATPGNPMDHVATINLNSYIVYNGPFGIGIDVPRGYAYVTVDASSHKTRILKLAVGEGDAAPHVVATLDLPSLSGRGYRVFIDSASGYGYIYGSYRSMFLKFALNEGDAAPTLIGSVASDPLPYNGDAIIDLAAGAAYLTISDDINTSNYYYEPRTRLFKIALGAGDALPSMVGALTISGADLVSAPILDPTRGLIYAIASQQQAQVIRFDPTLNQKDVIKATKLELTEGAQVDKLRFYSHAAEGSVRLALYTDGSPKFLAWQSEAIANNATEGWIEAPVFAGAPATLYLPAGTYWLAWQSDTRASVPSYTAGADGEGFSFDQPFGEFASSITAEQSTAERWSETIDYTLYDSPAGRAAGDLDFNGCSDAADLLFMLDHWHQLYAGEDLGVADFLALIDSYRQGPSCSE